MRAAREIDLPIDEVTLLEDRAHVLRRGEVEFSEAGETRLVIRDVAPVLSDKTLTASCSDNDGATIIDARMRREQIFYHEEEPPERGELAIQNENLNDELTGYNTRRKLLNGEIKQLGTVSRALLAEVSADAAWGGQATERWADEYDALTARERELRDERFALEHDIEELEEKLEDLRDRMNALGSPRSRFVAEIEIDLRIEAPGKVSIEVGYTTPGACWRPYHTAELHRAGDKVDVRTDGTVWQNTGEDWRDVQLVFSTERLSLGTKPPLLHTDRLAVQSKSEEVVVEAREQEIFTAGLGTKKQKAPEVPGIDDGGDVVRLRGQARANVPSDGRPYRTLIASFNADARTSRVLVAELIPAVILKSMQTNNGSQPLLAGPVDLIRDCGFVGRTQVLFIAPGEEFELGWGPDGALRVQREVEQLAEESKMLSSWTTRAHRVRLHLSNIGAERRVVEVTERVPVSEIEKVQIEPEPNETTEQKVPDQNGFVRWNVEMPPFGRETLKLGFSVRKHSDVRGL